MYRIYLDTSNRHLNKVSLLKNGEVLCCWEAVTDVVPAIEKLLKEYNISPNEVFVEYFEGPGNSFTGLKIGSTIANTFNFVTGKIRSVETKLPNYGREPNISTLRK